MFQECRFRRWLALLIGTFALPGCASINPARVSPMTLPTPHMLATRCPASSVTGEVDFATPVVASNAVKNLTDHAERVRLGLPTNLRDDKVMKTVIRLLLNRRFIALRSLAPTSSSRDTFERAAAATSPARLSHADFEAFHHAILSPNGDLFGRVIEYESAYFNGTFLDRLGAGLTKPALSTAVTDQQIAGFITALIEAVADELFFRETPVWIDDTHTSRVYYPGASGDMPSALAYSASPAPISQMAKDDKGCGMTKLKARVLVWLSGQAGTWAAGEAGIIMGAFGGVNAGPVIVLGKLSIGDNKLLLTIVQTVLSTAAKRAVFETTWPLLLRIDQLTALDSVKSIVDQLDLRQESGP